MREGNSVIVIQKGGEGCKKFLWSYKVHYTRSDDKSVPGNVAGTIFQTSKLAQYKLSNTVVEFAVLYV